MSSSLLVAVAVWVFLVLLFVASWVVMSMLDKWNRFP